MSTVGVPHCWKSCAPTHRQLLGRLGLPLGLPAAPQHAPLLVWHAHRCTSTSPPQQATNASLKAAPAGGLQRARATRSTPTRRPQPPCCYIHESKLYINSSQPCATPQVSHLESKWHGGREMARLGGTHVSNWGQGALLLKEPLPNTTSEKGRSLVAAAARAGVHVSNRGDAHAGGA